MHVVIAGMFAPYPGPFDGVEVWGCNATYLRQKNLARLYFFGPLAGFVEHDPNFVQDVNALEIPVIARQHYAEIPRSEAFPLDEILTRFFGSNDRARGYMTSTIAYMLADAIYSGAHEITIHRILSLPPSREYTAQKACLEFWCGLAAGSGIRLHISEDSNLCKPMPWQVGLYGYQVESSRHANDALLGGIDAAMKMPVEIRDAGTG